MESPGTTTVKRQMIEYSVELRIKVPINDETNPAEMLGLKASTFRRLEKEEANWWGFNGGDEEATIYWTDLAEGIDFVLVRLEPQFENLRRLVEKYDCIWWCGHFHRGFDGGPSIPPELLLRLSNIGVELFLDTYCALE